MMILMWCVVFDLKCCFYVFRNLVGVVVNNQRLTNRMALSRGFIREILRRGKLCALLDEMISHRYEEV